MNTPKRQVRVKDELWLPAKAKAARLDVSLSGVIRRLLREWLELPEG